MNALNYYLNFLLTFSPQLRTLLFKTADRYLIPTYLSIFLQIHPINQRSLEQSRERGLVLR